MGMPLPLHLHHHRHLQILHPPPLPLPLDLSHRNHQRQFKHALPATTAVPPPTVRRTSAATSTPGSTITRITSGTLASIRQASVPPRIDIGGSRATAARGASSPRLRRSQHYPLSSSPTTAHLPSWRSFDPGLLGGSERKTHGLAPSPTPKSLRRRRHRVQDRSCFRFRFRLCFCSSCISRSVSIGASPSCACESCGLGPFARQREQRPRGFGRVPPPSAWRRRRRSSVEAGAQAEAEAGAQAEAEAGAGAGAREGGSFSWEKAPISRPAIGFGSRGRRGDRLSSSGEFRRLLRGTGGGADRRWSHGCRYVPLFWDEEEDPDIGGSPPVGRQFDKMNFKKDALLPISTAPSGASILDGQKGKSARMTQRGAVVALSYMFCAVMLVMFNKAALSTYKFPCTNVIIVLQIVCSTATLFVLRKANMISFANEGSAVNLDEGGFVTMKTLQRASPLAISYLFYMVVGMTSIRGVNVPMYTTLRRTTVLFTMIMEYFLAGQKHSTPIISTVGLIVLGAFIAGARDLSFDSYGYFVVLISNVTTALYLTTISRLGKSTGLNSFGLMWCNGLICGPILLLWTILSGELALASQFPAVSQPSFQLVILLSCMMAFCLNYTIFLNTSLNSALTQTMCGNLKDFGTVLIGWLWFGGLPFDWLNIMGQLLGFLGSGLYAYCKFRGV